MPWSLLNRENRNSDGALRLPACLRIVSRIRDSGLRRERDGELHGCARISESQPTCLWCMRGIKAFVDRQLGFGLSGLLFETLHSLLSEGLVDVELEQVDQQLAADFHDHFDHRRVQAWQPERFEEVRVLQRASRNLGQVQLFEDTADHGGGSHVQLAVKKMPTAWIGTSHADFVARHPGETEMPWVDVGCLHYLSSMGYPYRCNLHGVFRDDLHTYVASSFIPGGDLLAWCERQPTSCIESEPQLRLLAIQIFRAVQQLHNASVVHRDLSLENILVSEPEPGRVEVKLIDFGMATARRYLGNNTRGKAGYQAPEMHGGSRHDGFLVDSFALGVVLFALATRQYPWRSTMPGHCRDFNYVRRHGLRAHLQRKNLAKMGSEAAVVMSESLIQLLEGLLAMDPEKRLTLGESESQYGSVWDEPWLIGATESQH